MSKKSHAPELRSLVEKHQKAAIAILVIFIILVIGGSAAIAYYAFQPSSEGSSTLAEFSFFHKDAEETVTEPEPTIIPRRIDGMLVAREDANFVPACVMIENAAFGGVRPQSGLSSSLVTYEVIVEGGITRYMAVFAGEEVDEIGPVRSARDTYLEIASEYNCMYSHAGGSYTALLALQRFSLRDLDALREYGYFWRDARKFAPHNLFTSWDNLHNAIVDHNWENEEPPSFDSWNFVDEGSFVDNDESRAIESEDELQAQPTNNATTSIIRYGGSYDSEFKYNPDLMAYERYNGGQLQTDAGTGEALTVKNVIIQYTGEGTSIEGKGRVNWPVTGEGVVEVLHEGKRWTGKWKKDSRLERTRFVAENGMEIPLVRGSSWVSFVPTHIESTIE